MGIYTKLADGIDEVDVIIAGGRFNCLHTVWQPKSNLETL